MRQKNSYDIDNNNDIGRVQLLKRCKPKKNIIFVELVEMKWFITFRQQTALGTNETAIINITFKSFDQNTNLYSHILAGRVYKIACSSGYFWIKSAYASILRSTV